MVVLVFLNYLPFIPPESWYWIVSPTGGRCDPNAPLRLDGANLELEWRFDNPRYSLPQGIFINPEMVFIYPWDNPSLPSNPNPGPYCQEMVFESNVFLAYYPCLSTDELNYYLGVYDYLVAKYRPGSKLVSDMYVFGVSDNGSPIAHKYFWYYMFYSDFVPYNDPGK